MYIYIHLRRLPQWLRSKHSTQPVMQKTQVRSLGQEDPLEESSNSVQYSCLENPMDREA